MSIAERVWINLPSRKPQLWENFPLALSRRVQRSVRSILDPSWFWRSVEVSLPTLGFRMSLVPGNSFIDGVIYSFGIYEISGTRLFEALLRPGMTVVDVGANTGYYSLLASRLVGKKGQVHSFEPVPGLATVLRRNIDLNGMNNVFVRHEAVSASSGTANLYLSRTMHNTGLSSLVDSDEVGPNADLLQVKTIRLDDLIRQDGEPVDFIKIDVEGAEELVFRGGERLFSSDRAPAIMFESYAVEPIAQRLSEWGYEIRRLHYTLQSGLEFRAIDDDFDDLFRGYEGTNFVAWKGESSSARFAEICEASRERIPRLLRWIAKWA